MTHRGPGIPCTCTTPGWMPGVEHVPIRWPLPAWITALEGKMRPVLVVDHIMQGYLSTMVDWAGNGGSKVITHFGIARDPVGWSGTFGRIVQFQSVLTPGIHASALNSPTAKLVLERAGGTYGANPYSVAIEHEGCSVAPVGYQVPPSLIYSPSNRWPEAMVKSSLEVKRWLFATVPSLGKPSRDTIIGHQHVDARNRANDPEAAAHIGQVWPRDRFIRELGGEPTSTTHTVRRGETLGAIAVANRIDVADLARWNGITNPNLIEGGQVLRLTSPAAPTPPPSPVADLRALQESSQLLRGALDIARSHAAEIERLAKPAA